MNKVFAIDPQSTDTHLACGKILQSVRPKRHLERSGHIRPMQKIENANGKIVEGSKKICKVAQERVSVDSKQSMLALFFYVVNRRKSQTTLCTSHSGEENCQHLREGRT